MDKVTQIIMDGGTAGGSSNYNGNKLPQTGTNEVLILGMAIFTLGIGIVSLIKYKKM